MRQTFHFDFGDGRVPEPDIIDYTDPKVERVVDVGRVTRAGSKRVTLSLVPTVNGASVMREDGGGVMRIYREYLLDDERIDALKRYCEGGYWRPERYGDWAEDRHKKDTPDDPTPCGSD